MENKWTEFEVVNNAFSGYEKDVRSDGINNKFLIIHKSDIGNHYGPVCTPVVEFTFVNDRLVSARLC